MQFEEIRRTLARTDSELSALIDSIEEAREHITSLTYERDAELRKIRRFEAKKLSHTARLKLNLASIRKSEPPAGISTELDEYAERVRIAEDALHVRYRERLKALEEDLLSMETRLTATYDARSRLEEELLSEKYGDSIFIYFLPSRTFAEEEMRYTLQLDGVDYTYGKLSEERLLRIRTERVRHSLLWVSDGGEELAFEVDGRLPAFFTLNMQPTPRELKKLGYYEFSSYADV